MRRKTKLWWHSLAGGFIGGGASALHAWLGMVVAKEAGIDVPRLNLNAVIIIFVAAGLASAMAYLKQSPLPPLSGDTDFFRNPTPPTQPEPPTS